MARSKVKGIEQEMCFVVAGWEQAAGLWRRDVSVQEQCRLCEENLLW